MKRQVRFGVWESNSSSTHSLTMVSNEEYEKWKNGEYYMCDGHLVSYEEIVKEYETKKSEYETIEDFMDDYSYYNFNDWWDRKEEYYETFSRTYKTKSGESVVAFGYYGQD
jgi:hypothetical protein